MPTRQDEDIRLWKQWKKTKSPQDASALVNQMMPLVRNDISRYHNNMNPVVVEAHAKDLILQAAENYDPNKGVAFSTFVKSYMVKMNQRSDGWVTPMKIPDHRRNKYNTFKNSYEDLAEKNNREPTIEELADDLRWSQAEVKRFLSEIREGYSEDRPFMSTYIPNQSAEEEIIDYIYHDLSPREKLLLEYTTGYGGKPKLSNKEIMKRMNLNQNQLSYERKKLADKIEKVMLSGHR